MRFSKELKGDPVPASDLARALELVLRQSGISPNSNAARLLRYIVSEAAAGRADRLKSFSIGQDVFQRGPDFDPSKDSIVRVEMKRLREILEHYYATTGAADPVQISVPRGSYVPQVTPVPASARDLGEAGWEASGGWRSLRRMRSGRGIAIVTAAVLVAGALLVLTNLRGAGVSGEGEPSLLIVTEAGVSDAAPATASDVLARFRNIELLTNPAPQDAARGADYELVLRPSGDGTFASLRVSDSGQVISSRVFDEADFVVSADPFDFTEFEVWLGQIASRNGVVETDYVRRGAYSGDFTCTVLTEAYFSDQTDARHLEARDCILKRLRDGHDSARLRTDLAMLYREEHSDQRNLMPGDPLQRAAQEARAAIALDRFDAFAYYALMTVQFALGATEEGRAVGERSLELNPFDGEAVGGFAARINYVGEHERALVLFDASRMLVPGGANWREYGYFLAHLGLDQPEAAASAGIGLQGLNNEIYLAAVAISASIRGDNALASQTKARLLDQEPDLRWIFERRSYAPGLIDKLMQRLDAI